MKYRPLVVSFFLLCSMPVGAVPAAEVPAAAAKPSVLIIHGRDLFPGNYGDFTWLKKLNEQGFQIDSHFLNEQPPRPITWDLITNYNCLVFMDLPTDEDVAKKRQYIWPKPPFRRELFALLDRYLAEGGGVFIHPNIHAYAESARMWRDMDQALARWGARLPLEQLQDPVTETIHPRSGVPFIYANNITPSPVSEGVKGIWFPVGPVSTWSFQLGGQPIEVSKDWIPVVRGSITSFTIDRTVAKKSMEADVAATLYHRPNKQVPPALYAIREVGAGRMGLTVLWPIFTVYGGTTWIHDGAVLDNGLARRASDFGRLFANTLRWLAEPSLKSGKLGGYVQDPKQLVSPNFRRKPDEFFGQFDSYQNPTPPGRVFKGLIGARTAYSTGKGAVAEYAEAATRAGLDFVVFLETFGKINEANYRKLEQACKQLSTDKLLLIPGLTIDNNIGNHMFVYGQGILWPKPSQLDGPNKDQLRTQCFDAKGELAGNDEDAKNWIWTNVGCNGRNLGFFDFREKKGMLIRNLRRFGILGVISYRDGKLVEDVTQDYLDYVTDANPPLCAAVDLVDSPAQLEAAVQQRHYLTHVAAPALAKLPEAMWYGHAYGRANVYFSSDPEIRAWAGTQRFMSYAGESFVTARRRARPEAWVVSDAGLKEIVIYSETAPYRRFLLNGAKEFRQTFEWAYDRHREMVLVATDVNGRRAVSAARSLWADANANTWCGDRQNGEMWHGPITFPGPQRPQFATGPTWDGGPSAFVGAQYECHPLIVTKAGEYEGGGMLLGGRWMEGNVYPTCFDDSVANFACVGENNYAPGDVANAYHTLGPVLPAKYMIFTLRRTQFIQRGAGPSPDGHAFYAERVGGNLALIEGTITVKQDADLANVVFANIIPAFPKTPENYPLWAVRTASGNVGMGRFETFAGPGLGAEQPRPGFTLAPGDYVALIPAQLGNNSICFNVGDAPIQAVPGPFANWNLKPARLGAYKKGDVISWRYLVIYDGMDESAHNLMRVEQLRRYYGLAGEGGCGIVVKQGKLLSQKGLIDLAPENGVVDVTVPHPGWRLGLPLGIRFIGFNPKWTMGQLQVEGYSPGFYTNGRNVYRNLGLDDRHMAFVAVFPDAAKNTHNIVGHPVQCDNSDLVIELTQLGTRPFEYRVAVNNPTDQPITTVLKKSMDLPGFEFADTRVEAPAGGYVVVKEK